jgi:hypothetical protein
MQRIQTKQRIIYLYNEQLLVSSLVGWLLGYHLLLMDFGPYDITFMNVYIVMTVAMVMLLRDFKVHVLLCWLLIIWC